MASASLLVLCALASASAAMAFQSQTCISAKTQLNAKTTSSFNPRLRALRASSLARPGTFAKRHQQLSKIAAATGEVTGTVIVTDGRDELYSIRSVFQDLYDHAKCTSLRPYCSSIAKARKALLSRESRYSGLIDILDWQEGDLSAAMTGAEAWIGLNCDEGSIKADIATAKAAGVKRCILVFSVGGLSETVKDPAALESALKDSGLVYTVIRTGEMTKGDGGAALALEAIDQPECASVMREDVHRVAAEALTLPDSFGKVVSMVPTSGEGSNVLKEMRYAGSVRRQEISAMWKGDIATAIREKELANEEAVKTEAEIEQEAEEKKQTEEERQAGIEAQLADLKEKGIALKKKMEEDEIKKKAAREERQVLYQTGPSEDDEEPEGEGGADSGEEGGATEKKEGDEPPKEPVGAS